jgi:NAD(P)H-flavin reductase
LGLPIGGHVFFYASMPDPESGEVVEVARKYTPTSEVHQKGYCDFIIKVYHAGENPRFPHGGMMSQYLEKMEIGKYLKMEGPKGKLSYTGCGNFYISKKYQIRRKIGMVAGGTGITPIFQIIQSVLANKDKVKLTLLFANKSESDILIREHLEQFQEDHPDLFTLHYIIDKAEHPETWKHETGYITKEILERLMPKSSDDTIILTCGPPIMRDLVTKFLPNHLVHEF